MVGSNNVMARHIVPLAACLLTACASGLGPQENARLAEQERILNLLTPRDVRLADQTLQSALETQRSGRSLSWNNQRDNHRGSITPLRTYKTAEGVYCREYSERIEAGGGVQQIRATACRDRQGQWRLLES